MATFPSSFHEVLESCGISKVELAHMLNLSKRRFYGIFAGRNKMDRKEFMDIKTLVEKLKKISNEK